MLNGVSSPRKRASGLLRRPTWILKRTSGAFSEEYTYIPERLLAGRDKVGWHFMINYGKFSRDASLPDKCLPNSQFLELSSQLEYGEI